MVKKSRAIFALTTVLVIIFLMEPIAQFEAVEANPFTFLRFTRIQINSPQYHVYVSSNVDISFEYYAETNFPQVDSFSFSLDSKANSTLDSSKSSVPQINFTKYSVFKTLENLSNDNHKLIVYAYFSNKTVSPILNTTIVVDTTFIQPKLLMISPLNKTTYTTRQVSIIYTINAKIISSAYTLDTSEYAPKWTDCTGNITLSNLSNGSHKLKLSLTIQPHSYTPYEHYFDTVYFNIESNEANSISAPTPSSTSAATPYLPPNRNAPHLDPIVYFIPVSVIVAVVAVSALLFRKHQKKPLT